VATVMLLETPIQTLTYAVPSDAETITILTAGMSTRWIYSIAILASDPVWYSTNHAAVGGIVLPANLFADISPWLAVIGLVGCIGTLVLVAKKRQS